MVARAVIPDLVARSGVTATIHSRVLRTWGMAESTLAEVLGPRLTALDEAASAGLAAPTIAFLASGIEGIKVRITVKAATVPEAEQLIATEEKAVRDLLGPVVFGVDEETMEAAVGGLLREQGRTLATAESLTGGLVGARITAVPGASEWFRGSIVAYATEVKQKLLGIAPGPAVSEAAAREMAEGAVAALGADVGLSLTGVAGPDQAGRPTGRHRLGRAVRRRPYRGPVVPDALRRTGTDPSDRHHLGARPVAPPPARDRVEAGGVPGARLFVAVWPGPGLMGWLRSLDRPARPGVRWTTEAQWHVTLRFVGPVEAESAAALRGSLSEVAAGCPPVTARAGPRVEVLRAGIWVLPVGGLEALAGAVEGATASVGQPPPTRAFRGHVTLARTRRPGPGARPRPRGRGGGRGVGGPGDHPGAEHPPAGRGPL